MRSGWLYLDIEGTGLNPSEDRIVELCLYRDGELRVRRLNPTIPIPPEVTAVHGISDQDVKDCPTFRQVAGSVQQIVDGAVAFCGYSIRKYDTVLLDAELRRAGQRGLARDPSGELSTPEVDLYQIWQQNDPRTLVAAAKKFAGVDLENSHSADSDTEVLPATLEGMLSAYGMDGLSLQELADFCRPDTEVDRAGKFKRLESGVVVFNFGQNTKGKPITEDPGFLRWMLTKDFPEDTKAFARRFLEEIHQTELVAAHSGPTQESLF